MAVKQKLANEAELNAVEEALRPFYVKQDDGSYEFDLDVTALKNAKNHEKTARQDAEDKLRAAHEELTKFKEEQLKAEGKYKELYETEVANKQTLNDSWEAKLAEKLAEKDAASEGLTATIRSLTIGSLAKSMAEEISVAPDLIQPFIEKRLSVDMATGKAIVSVLDAEGKVSATTHSELKQEFAKDARFSAIIKANSASSGKKDGIPDRSSSASSQQGPSLAEMSPAELAAHIGSKINQGD